MSTEVQYHSEDFGPRRPAINVKVYATGLEFWPDVLRRMDESGDFDERDWPEIDRAYERVHSDFWQAAVEIADQNGLGPIEQEGRSGGWLVFSEADLGDNPETSDLNMIREWLAGYASMRQWVESFIADAPRKVRDLAQQYAMDRAGEDAARRMFAFDRGSV